MIAISNVALLGPDNYCLVQLIHNNFKAFLGNRKLTHVTVQFGLVVEHAQVEDVDARHVKDAHL